MMPVQVLLQQFTHALHFGGRICTNDGIQRMSIRHMVEEFQRGESGQKQDSQ